MCKENRHALIWTWIKGKHVLACVIVGCGYVVGTKSKKG